MKHVYQIKVTGYDNCASMLFIRYSQKVYVEPPQEEDIQRFVDNNCNIQFTTNPLDRSTINVKIEKLEVIQ